MELGTAISKKVFEHNFDPQMLEQFETLRAIRLNMAEKMLKNLDRVGKDLVERGLASESEVQDHAELKAELEERCATLRARMQRPDVVFADEISLYVDLLEGDEAP